MTETKRKKMEKFIADSSNKFNNKFDYSLIKNKWKNRDTKVDIICPVHGIFEMTPVSHLHASKHGCRQCSIESRAKGRKKSIDAVVLDARKVHGDKYDYSKAIYVNALTEFEIVCPKHGSFWQRPNDHISGKAGCPGCYNEGKMNKDNFIKKAIEVHGNIYDYSLVNYINSNEPVDIICPIHGKFSQSPTVHILQGSGCNACGYVEMKRKLKGI